MLCNLKAWLIIKIIFLITYVILCISVEALYRTPLFDKSLTIETELYSSSSTSLITFFKVISIFGTQAIILPILFIVFLTFPITKSYTFLSIVILTNYFTNILKLIYGSHRPFWVIPEIKHECDIGFGNPSGHAFSSISVYLSLWNIITDIPFYKRSSGGRVLKYISLLVFIILCIAIIISRIYLSVHSINQVLFGGTLGFALYFYFFHALSLGKFTIKQFIKYITSKSMIIVHSIKFALYLTLLLLLFIFIHHDINEYNTILLELCPHTSLYRKFNNNGFYIGLTLFMLIGGHYGLMILFAYCRIAYPHKEEVINVWNKGSVCSLMYKLCLAIPFAAMMIFVVAISKNIELYLIFIFKGAIPYLFTGFLMFGPYIISCIKCKISYSLFYDLIVKPDCEISYNDPNDIIGNKIPHDEDVAIEINIHHNNSNK